MRGDDVGAGQFGITKDFAADASIVAAHRVVGRTRLAAGAKRFGDAVEGVLFCCGHWLVPGMC
jgi:hypothetical protein